MRSESVPHCPAARSVWKAPCASVTGKGTRFLFTGYTVEKHMLSESLDAEAFKTLGMDENPFPRQLFEKNQMKEDKNI